MLGHITSTISGFDAKTAKSLKFNVHKTTRINVLNGAGRKARNMPNKHVFRVRSKSLPMMLKKQDSILSFHAVDHKEQIDTGADSYTKFNEKTTARNAHRRKGEQKERIGEF
jgi:hypothetical protein